MKQRAILAIYLEPTPYILGLIRALAQQSTAPLEVVFAGSNLSQPWELDNDICGYETIGKGMLSSFRFVFRRIRRKDYVLVHLAGWSGHPILWLAMLAALWRGVPITVESDTPRPVGQTLGIRIFKRIFYPILFRLPACFLPGGSRQADYLRQYGVSTERIQIACMTVDVAAILAYASGLPPEHRIATRHQYGFGEEHCVVLYVGRLEPHKGLEDLLSAFSASARKCPHIRLLIVGDGSMRNMLQAMLDGQGGIQLAGRLAGTPLLDAYLAADIFVLPSRFEPWGLVVNEAMAAGLPVIVSDQVGCLDDLVENSVTGFIVPAFAPALLAVKIQELAENAEMRGHMAKNARRKISGWTLEHEADIVGSTWKRLTDLP